MKKIDRIIEDAFDNQEDEFKSYLYFNMNKTICVNVDETRLSKNELTIGIDDFMYNYNLILEQLVAEEYFYD